MATALIIQGVYAEDAKWNSSFDLGATITSGNSDTSLVTLGYQASKLGKADEYFTNFSYTFGETESETTNDELLATASWNHLISETVYAGLRFDFRRDDIADIEYRVGLSGVLGKYLIKNDSTYLAFEAGVGYTTESVGSEEEDFLNVYVGDRFEHKLNDKTRIYQTLGITAPADDFDDFSLVAELGIETFLSERLALKIYAQDKYEGEPAEGLEENDLRFVTGVSYKF